MPIGEQSWIGWHLRLWNIRRDDWETHTPASQILAQCQRRSGLEGQVGRIAGLWRLGTIEIVWFHRGRLGQAISKSKSAQLTHEPWAEPMLANVMLSRLFYGSPRLIDIQHLRGLTTCTEEATTGEAIRPARISGEGLAGGDDPGIAQWTCFLFGCYRVWPCHKIKRVFCVPLFFHIARVNSSRQHP